MVVNEIKVIILITQTLINHDLSLQIFCLYIYLIDFVFDFQFAAYFFLLDSNVFFVLAFKGSYQILPRGQACGKIQEGHGFYCVFYVTCNSIENSRGAIPMPYKFSCSAYILCFIIK